MNRRKSKDGEHTHGGRRPGAGRKKVLANAPNHVPRTEIDHRHPLHIALHCVPGTPRLRQHRMYQLVRRILALYLDLEDFRIVHVSLQRTCFHFIVEAVNKDALSRGMQSLVIRLAKAINQAWHREGKVFAYRYSARPITTGLHARDALAYVLNNWRRHPEDANNKELVDGYSSAIAFDGWTKKPTTQYEQPLPVSKPRTRLLREGWKPYGRIDPFEVPEEPF